MAFPIGRSLAAGLGAGAAGMFAGAAYMDGYRDDVVNRIDDPVVRNRGLHFHDGAASMASLGVQGIGFAIAYTGAQVDAPNAIAFGIGVMAAAAGARIGWMAAQHVDLPF